MHLIVGLGNPGGAYANSRHNVGIRVLERAAARWAIRLTEHQLTLQGSGTIGAETVELTGPLGWMNLSGPPLRTLLSKLGLSPHELIVIHDDLDLELGRLRIKQAGGHGGHNGIRSVMEALGTAQFVRLKIGIGRPAPGQDSADYVLERLSRDELDVLNPCLERAVDALECLVQRGTAVAMNEFNIRDAKDGENGLRTED